MNFMRVIFESHLVKFQPTPDPSAKSGRCGGRGDSEASGEAGDYREESETNQTDGEIV